MKRTREYAYAKINLFLQVDGKREDGFHELQTVMHSVGLYDELLFSLDRDGEDTLRFSCNSPYLPTDSRNLAVRAAQLFKVRTGNRGFLRIDMKKRIPVAAGMAGGSSDAAAVLRACNRLFNYPLSTEELFALGGELGSVVAFCLQGGTALCRGRGEVITPISVKTNLAFVVASAPKEHVSTPAAFASLDRAYADFDGSILPVRPAQPSDMVEALTAGNLTKIAALMHNDFESVVLPTCPGANRLRQAMMAHGALAAIMSGSGPSVFGIFPDYATSLRAAAALGYGAHAVLSAPSFSFDGKKKSQLDGHTDTSFDSSAERKRL